MSLFNLSLNSTRDDIAISWTPNPSYALKSLSYVVTKVDNTPVASGTLLVSDTTFNFEAVMGESYNIVLNYTHYASGYTPTGPEDASATTADSSSILAYMHLQVIQTITNASYGKQGTIRLVTNYPCILDILDASDVVIATAVGTDKTFPLVSGVYKWKVTKYFATPTSNDYTGTRIRASTFNIIGCTLTGISVDTIIKPTTAVATNGSFKLRSTVDTKSYDYVLKLGGTLVQQSLANATGVATFNALAVGIYTYTITDTLNVGCSFTDTINISNTLQYYQLNKGVKTYTPTFQTPIVYAVKGATSPSDHNITFSWEDQGSEGGPSTVYYYNLYQKTSAAGTPTPVFSGNGTALNYSYVGEFGFIYEFSVYAVYNPGGSSVTSSTKTISYYIPYYYKGAGGTIAYFDECTAPDIVVKSDNTETLQNIVATWTPAGMMDGNPSSYYYDVNTINNGNIIPVTKISATTATFLANLDDVYTLSVYTDCNPTTSPTAIKTLKPMLMTLSATNVPQSATNGSLIVTTNIPNALLAITVNSVTTNIVMTGTTINLARPTGAYSIKATDPSDTFNTKIRTATILGCSLTTVTVAVTSPVTFEGNGSVILTANNAISYKYTLLKSGATIAPVTNATGSATFSSLEAGSYTYTVESPTNTSCVITGAFTINKCDLVITSITVTNAIVNGGNGNAVINVSPASVYETGVSVEYAARLTTGGTTTYGTINTFALPVGAYTAFVRYKTPGSLYYCQSTTSFIITEPQACNLPTTISRTITNATVYGGNGTVTSNLSAFNGSKQYRVMQGATVIAPYTSTPLFSLPVGSYTYVVDCLDIPSCNRTSAFTIADPVCNLTSTSGYSIVPSDRSFGTMNGSVSIVPKGGTTVIGSLVYKVKHNVSLVEQIYELIPADNNAHTFIGLDAGAYTLTISYKSTGCTISSVFNIGTTTFTCNLSDGNATMVAATVSVTNGTSYQTNDGQVNLTIGAFNTDGQTLEYLILTSADVIYKPAQSTKLFTMLAAGSYKYVIRYLEMPTCKHTILFTVTEPPRCNITDTGNVTVSTTNTVYQGSTGTATLSITPLIAVGATPQYRIASSAATISAASWQGSGSFTALAAGTYYYEVRYTNYAYCNTIGTIKTFVINHTCPISTLSITAGVNVAKTDIVFAWDAPTVAPIRYDCVLYINNTVSSTFSQAIVGYTVGSATKNVPYRLEVTAVFTDCVPNVQTSPAYTIAQNLPCAAPTTLTGALDTAVNSKIKFTWNGTAPAYLFSYKASSESVYTTVETTDKFYSAPLVNGTLYNINVSSKCAVLETGTTNNSTATNTQYTRYLCILPTITVTPLTTTNIQIGVVTPNNSFVYSYKKTTDPTFPTDILVSNATSFSMVTDPSFAYNIRAKSMCVNPEDTISVYASSTYTRTCPLVDFSTINYTTTGNNQMLTLVWNSLETSFAYRYKQKDALDSTYTSWSTIGSSTFSFTPVANKVYTVQIKTLCGASESVPVEKDVVLYRCDIVSGIATSYTGTGFATVSWIGFNGANKYKYTYNKIGENASPLETLDTTPTFQFTPTANTTYNIGVKSLCIGSVAESNYITTTYRYDNCPLIATSDITWLETGDSTTVSWIGHDFATTYRYTYVIDDESVTFTSTSIIPSFTFTPLVNRSYTLKIAAICNENTSTDTQVTYLKSVCPIIPGVITTVENGTLTNVLWDAGINVEQYLFRYRTNTANSTFTIIPCGNSNSTSFTAEPGIEYILGVSVVCNAANNVSSSWVALTDYVKPLPGISYWLGQVYDNAGGNNTLPNLVSNQVQSLSLNGDDMWVGAGENGIWHLNISNLQTEKFDTSSSDVQVGSNLQDNNILSLVQTGASLWAGTPQGLWRKDINTRYTVGSNPVQSVKLPVFTTGDGTVVNKLYTLNKDSGNVFVVNTDENRVTGYITVPKSAYRMRYIYNATSDKHMVYVQNEADENITVINAESDLVENTLLNEGMLVVSGEYSYISNFIDNTVSIIKMDDNTIKKVYTVPVSPVSLAVSGDKLFVVSRNAGKVTVIDVNTDTSTTLSMSVTVSEQPTLAVVGGNTIYVMRVNSATLDKINITTNAISSITFAGLVKHIFINGSTLYVMTNNGVQLIDTDLNTNGDILDYNNAMFASKGDNDLVYLTNRTNTIATYNQATSIFAAAAYVINEPAYQVLKAKDFLYVTTERNGIHRLSVIDTLDSTNVRVFALLGKVVDMNYVGEKFIYITLENSKNVYTIDSEITELSEIVLDTLAINYPIRNTAYVDKYYILHRSGEKVVVVNTDNNYLESFAYVKNNAQFITNLDNSGFRFVGGVDNLASLWMNGEMRGSIWHGGTWARGMFREDTLNVGALDYFDSPVITASHQSSIWLRGLWLSGYFSHYNDTAIPENSDYYTQNGNRSIFMGLKAGNAFSQDNLFGLSSTDMDNIKSDIFINPSTNDHSYASIFARRMLKTIAGGDKAYLSIFNGRFVNGILFDDDKLDDSRTVASQYATISKYFFDYTAPEDEKVKVYSNNQSWFLENIKQSKTTTFKIPTDWSSLYYYYGQAKITNTNFLKKYYNFGVEGTMWRHNHSTYGDGTQFSAIPSATLPYGASVAQGAGLIWNPGELPGEPRYYSSGSLTQP